MATLGPKSAKAALGHKKVAVVSLNKNKCFACIYVLCLPGALMSKGLSDLKTGLGSW